VWQIQKPKAKHSTRCHVLTDAFLVQVGDIIVSFALLEETMRHVIQVILPQSAASPYAPSIVTAGMSFKQLCTVAVSLCLDRFGKNNSRTEEMRRLVKQCHLAEDQRNAIAHSYWGGSGWDGENNVDFSRLKITAREKHGWVMHSEAFRESDLAEIAASIHELITRVGNFRWELAKNTKVVR
jgi:hypothetical protein